MPHPTTAPAVRPEPAVDLRWADAVVLVDRLRDGHPLPSLDGIGLLAGEQATLETEASYEQWRAGRPPSSMRDRDPVQVVVTNRRLLVGAPHPGGVSLWHVDLENLQLGRTDGQWHLDLHPVGINPGVRLRGASAPLIAVHVAHTVFPTTWSRLSGLLPLLDSAA